jgi:hypothetical protein
MKSFRIRTPHWLIQVTKSERMSWAWHLTRMGKRGKIHTGFWRAYLQDRDHLEDPHIDERGI